MKLQKFSTFAKSYSIRENSDLDWSDKNWDEAGVDGENPPNNGLEGTSAYKDDYYAGDYGETSDEDQDQTEDDLEKKKNSVTISDIKAQITDLTARINKISKSKK